MLRIILVFLGNVLLLPINILLLIPRLLFKVLINNKAAVWIKV